MTVERFAISFDKELAKLVRRAAASEPTSTWLADAARRKLRSEGLLAVVRDWERVHGTITAEEISAVERRQERAQAQARAKRRSRIERQKRTKRRR